MQQHEPLTKNFIKFPVTNCVLVEQSSDKNNHNHDNVSLWNLELDHKMYAGGDKISVWIPVVE